jgi:hypothetical protein
MDWVNLNFKQNFSRQAVIFVFTDRKIGENVASNRLTVINNKMQNAYLYLLMNTSKVREKELFLKYPQNFKPSSANKPYRQFQYIIVKLNNKKQNQNGRL